MIFDLHFVYNNIFLYIWHTKWNSGVIFPKEWEWVILKFSGDILEKSHLCDHTKPLDALSYPGYSTMEVFRKRDVSNKRKSKYKYSSLIKSEEYCNVYKASFCHKNIFNINIYFLTNIVFTTPTL